jgi:D-methionine transport system ATP-binding protein
MSREPVVEFQNLGLQGSLGGRWLVQGLSGSVGAGEVLLVTGAIGSGKTTLLRLLDGLVSQTAGELRWWGQGLAQIGPTPLRRRVAWVSGQPRLLGQTVGQALLYPLELQQCELSQAEARRREICREFGIGEDWFDRRQEQLSLTDALWVTIARAMMTQPELLLLDDGLEALGAGTATVDQDRQVQLLGLLQGRIGRGMSLIVSSTRPLLWQGLTKAVASQVLVLGPQQTASSDIDWDRLTPTALVDPDWD